MENPLDDNFAIFARETLEKWKTPGVSIAVVDGQNIFAEGYGFATLPDKPATPETLWHGASMAKSFTAAVLAKIIDDKEHTILSKGWKTPIHSIIPDDFALQDEWLTSHLTLEDAVCHRTGMARQDRASVRVVDGKKVGPKEIVRNFRNLVFTEEPRTKFMYSNLMYVALSHVIESIKGKALGDVLNDEIWETLGMESTYFSTEDALKSSGHLATGYYWDDKKETWGATPPQEVDDMSGAGALISSVLDMAKWLKCLLHQEAPFSEEAHKDIRTPRMMGAMPDKCFDINMYGLGWQRTTYKGRPMYHHSGGLHAHSGHTYWFPDQKFGVVAMGNTALRGNAAEETLAYRLIDNKLGIQKEEQRDVAATWEMIMKMFDNSSRAVDMLFPNRANPPLPSTLQTDQLTGTYHDVAYGSIALREEPHPDEERGNEKILVADRPEMTYKYRLELHHVSADHWIVYDKHIDVPDSLYNDFSAGEFRIGADGKVSSLDVKWEYHVGVTTPAGFASFKKIS